MNVHRAYSVTVVPDVCAGTVAVDAYDVPPPPGCVVQPANVYVPVDIVGTPVGLPVAADVLPVDMLI